MKINRPITQKEVEFNAGETIVSRTNLKGQITHVNQTFLNISGFSEEELMGKQHNIVRHPDMPSIAFEDLWRTVQAGNPWTGIVKNRCKNGDHYWVRANVVPITQQGVVTEYLSVRVPPTRQEIKDAEQAYKRLSTEDEKKTSWRSRLPAFTLNQRLAIPFLAAFVLLVIAFIGLNAFSLVGLVLSIFVLLAVFFACYFLLNTLILSPLRALDYVFQNMAEGRYSDSIVLTRADEIGELLRSTNKMQIKLGYDLDAEKYTSQAALRIKNALDVCHTCVILVDSIGEIIYANYGFVALIAGLEEQLKTELPELDASTLLGSALAKIYPGFVCTELNALTEPVTVRKVISGITFDLVFTPVFDTVQQRIGTVIEWNDITEILKKQQQEKKIAEENAAIRRALDECHTNVMLADNNKLVTYMNGSMQQMLQDTEQAIQKDFSDFKADKLFGKQADFFQKSALNNCGPIDSINEPTHTEIVMGGRTFTLIITPVFVGESRLGTVIEWSDITESLETLANERRIAAENQRVRAALDCASANVMLADTDFNIIYCNNSVAALMQANESDFKKDLPAFNASTLVGNSIDVFHKQPDYQRKILETLERPQKTDIVIGGRYMDLYVTPVFSHGEERIGTVVEWKDRTLEVATEKEIDTIVEAASCGDLSRRVSLLNKEGFFESLTWKLNGLQDNVERIIRESAGVLRSISNGDLTQTISGDYKGVFAQLQSDSNAMSDKLSSVINKITQSANSVSSASNQIAAGTQDLSQRTEEQAASLEQTASSMEQMTSSVQQNAMHAKQTSELAEHAQLLAEEGGNVLKDTISSMEAIRKSSKEINDIIGVIDEIAFQTNLLALNAAVEAARAGEHGRGFAVVASEVRNLAQRSSSSAKAIKDLIKDSSDKVEEGAALANSSGTALTNIVNAVQQVSELIKDIAESADEQNGGISQVNVAISQMDNMTQQNAALVEEASAAAEAMREQASDMLSLVQFFTLSGQRNAMAARVDEKNTADEKITASARKATVQPNGLSASVDLASDDDWETF